MTNRKLPLALSFGAALSMAATPLAAAELPRVSAASSAVPAAGSWDAGSVNAGNHRHYGYRRDRTSVGDILAGVLIIGGIAAVASAASKNSRYRYRDVRYPDSPYEYRTRGDSRYSESRGIDRAVDMCVAELEREARVDQVDEVDRTPRGWRVSGLLYDGRGFSCHIGNDGRIDDVDFDGGHAWDDDGRDYSYTDRDPGPEDRQYSAERYRQAWAERDANQAAAQPAYPGGPMPGQYDYGDDLGYADPE